jgi:hypothetical protein
VKQTDILKRKVTTMNFRQAKELAKTIAANSKDDAYIVCANDTWYVFSRERMFAFCHPSKWIGTMYVITIYGDVVRVQE